MKVVRASISKRHRKMKQQQSVSIKKKFMKSIKSQASSKYSETLRTSLNLKPNEQKRNSKPKRKSSNNNQEINEYLTNWIEK